MAVAGYCFVQRSLKCICLFIKYVSVKDIYIDLKYVQKLVS